MAYRVIQMNPQLIYIRLNAAPTPQDDRDYVTAVKQILDGAEQKLYFLIDFRNGMTTDVATIRQLAKLTEHPNFGESTSFASSTMQSVYSELFAQMRQSAPENALHMSPAKAIQYLESLQPGITQGIDWDALLANKDE